MAVKCGKIPGYFLSRKNESVKAHTYEHKKRLELEIFLLGQKPRGLQGKLRSSGCSEFIMFFSEQEGSSLISMGKKNFKRLVGTYFWVK